MPICKPQDIALALPPGARLLGLDVGARTVGVAVSDINLTIATARTVIPRGRKFQPTADALLELMDETAAGGAVVGLPLDLSGRKGPRAQASQAFAFNFMHLHDMPIAFWDERMSTNAATRAMLEADLSRAKRDANIDKTAAAFILQGFLDHLHDSGV
jgi:putative Holliday junction resolvase